LIFLTQEDRVLLLKGASDKRLWANLYNGIGGHIEAGEDVISSARRELKEETGITPTELWLCGVVIIDTGKDMGIGIFVFRGACSGQSLIQSKEGKPEWIPINKIDQLPMVEDLPTLLPKVLNMEPSSSPFSALYQYDADGNLKISFS
jgi:8-oxo-dGTP diphosphatase